MKDLERNMETTIMQKQMSNHREAGLETKVIE